MSPQNTPNPVVVLVEDDVVLSEMYAKKLGMAGLTVERAMDGEEGLSLIRKVNPDLVLLDIMMPKKNGLDTLKDLRADPAFANTYVVLLSNVGDESYIDEGLKLGANQYMMKSNFTPSEVVDQIKKWLGETS